jgi:hypothetical protein
VEETVPELTEAETLEAQVAPSLETAPDTLESAEPAVVAHIDSSAPKGEFDTIKNSEDVGQAPR